MLLVFVIVFGVVVGMVASHKGRSFLLWFLYGAALFPIGLTHAILVKPVDAEEKRRRKAARADRTWLTRAGEAAEGQTGGGAVEKWFEAANEARTGEGELNWEQRAVVKVAQFFSQGDRPPSAAVRPPRPSSGGTALGAKCPRCGLMQMARPTCKACGAPLGGAP